MRSIIEIIERIEVLMEERKRLQAAARSKRNFAIGELQWVLGKD